MKTKVVLEKTNTGYSAYLPSFSGVAVTGDSFSEVKENVREALDFHLEGMREEELDIPKEFQGSYELDFHIDVQTLFDWISGIVTKSGLARITNMNQSLVSQYANGIKNPSQKQLAKIEQALHKFGQELLSVNLGD
ncbi:MAG: type II toxin-antitoxin system HicB family antitoxin [Carboxylicivirga sp.]|jgi:predicted RNase H-like HicB family nuclease|nr:type II toxin-antitoxin system HicB family antitoxin [Carboxylicivirga sp.]